METVATFERVKEAYDNLRLLGERPSADRILAIVGGSKTTIVGHMRTILDQFAREKSVFDPAREMLEASAATMARRLWEEATRLAERSSDLRIQTLVSMQAGIFDDLKAAMDAEEAAVARANLAEQRVAALEAQLAAMETAEAQLGQLRDFMETLRLDPQMPAMAQMLVLLKDKKRHDKDAIYTRMIAMGYETAAVHRARYHALEADYIVEIDGDGDIGTGLKLTKIGQAKVA